MAENVEKLPKWAQQKIQQLEKDLQSAKDALAKQYTPEETDILLDRGMRSTSLPAGMGVTFKLIPEREGWVTVRIDRSEHRRPRLDVNGDTSIAALPMAANRLQIIAGRDLR